MKKLRVLFVSIAYLPIRIPSDKQFVSDLIKHLPEDIEPAVWTLNEAEPTNRIVGIGNRQVPYRSVCRLSHKPLSSGDNGLVPHPKHNPFWNLAEISLSLGFAVFRSLQKYIVEHKPDIIHFTDHIGPVLRPVRLLYPHTIITCAKPSARIHSARLGQFYSLLIRVSLSPADAIIAFSQACKEELKQAGIETRKIYVIPWGVEEPYPTSMQTMKLIRQRYEVPTNDLLIVGIIRASRATFLQAISLLKSKTNNMNIRFVFAMRPTKFVKQDTELSNNNVLIVKASSDFYDLLSSADGLLCIQDSESTVALPPLVWLEAMVRGTPVIALSNPGVEETIENGQTGIVYHNSEEMIFALEKLFDRKLLTSIKKGAIRLCSTKYNVTHIAERYTSVWKTLYLNRLLVNPKNTKC